MGHGHVTPTHKQTTLTHEHVASKSALLSVLSGCFRLSHATMCGHQRCAISYVVTWWTGPHGLWSRDLSDDGQVIPYDHDHVFVRPPKVRYLMWLQPPPPRQTDRREN